MVKKLELVWAGKDEPFRVEPRLLVEDATRSNLANDAATQNLLIHGDNLLALKALESKYAGQVKCVYIDPPYNTGSAFEHYDDNFEHSQWLNLMRPRLELLWKLLREDGSIWISIDDDERDYLKILCDEVFGRNHFVAAMIWQRRTSRENRRVFSFSHDYILVYVKNKSIFEKVRNSVAITNEILARYKNPDNDPRGPWQSVSANAQGGHGTKSQFYELMLPSGRTISPPPGRCWLYTKEKMEREIAAGNVYCGKDGNSAPRVKKFLKDSQDTGVTPETLWLADDVGTNDEAKKEILKIFNDSPFDTPKPERLLHRILHIATNPGDLVLDSFLGSGTTCAVAHKMGRRWIGIELGDHAYTHCKVRLDKVIDGSDPGGVSKACAWSGGGGYRFYELAPSLITKDDFGEWIINPEYNPEMLASAVALHEGFRYQPDASCFWKQSVGSEKSYLFVTTRHLTAPFLEAIQGTMAEGEYLVIACKSYAAGLEKANEAITIKKIPQMLLDRCEFGLDNYNLNILSAEEEG